MPFDDLKKQVDLLYRDCACLNHSKKEPGWLKLSADGEEYIDNLIKSIYDENAIPDTDAGLIRMYGNKLGAAVVDGYGSDLVDFTYQNPNYGIISALQNNVWQFSAAKTNTQLRAFAKALVGPDGQIRSFKDFRIAAQQITGEQLRWLETEYNSALRGAQMAAKWQAIQADKELFPVLEFDAVIDSHSSAICPPLDKVRKPVDDPFWLKWYPPNHFNCRSTVRQLRDGEITPDDQISYPEKISPMFAGNVGVSGLIFPPDHPYFTDADPHIIGNATLYMPEDEQYLTTYEAPEGNGKVTVNRKTAIENKPDLEQLQRVAEVLADKGMNAEILPEIYAAETELRNQLLPDAKAGKNPDMRVDGEYTEVKTPGKPVTFEKLQQNVAKGVRQANELVILLEADFSEAEMRAVAEERFSVFPELESIGYVTIDGEYIEFTRQNKRQEK